MTKDSICKDCVWCKYAVYEKKGDRLEEASCKKMAVAVDASGDIKVLECSEFERVQKIPSCDFKKLAQSFEHIDMMIRAAKEMLEGRLDWREK